MAGADTPWLLKSPDPIAELIFRMYRLRSARLRGLLRWLLKRKEGADYEYYSITLRRIFATYHQVQVGLYTHGACFKPGAFPLGTKIGRYASLARGAVAHGSNHPMNLKSCHAFFFNPLLGVVPKRLAVDSHLEIGNDVWIGDDVIVLPAVTKIGHGAVVGAGSVLNKDVPPYAVVVGHPARVVRYRFSKDKIAELLDENWWEHDLAELRGERLSEFTHPLEEDEIR